MLSNSLLGAYTYAGQYWGSKRPHAVSVAGNYGFSYDANGNQIEKTDAGQLVRSIVYDGENRPIAVVNPSGVVNYRYGPDGIRVNALLPGGTQTAMADAFAPDEEAKNFVKNRHALKRTATPKEIAEAALVLADDASSFVTGTSMLVDGGVSITKS